MSFYVNCRSADEAWSILAKAIIQNPDGSELSRSGETKYINQVTINLNNPSHHLVISRKPVISLFYAFAELVWFLHGDNRSDVINFFNPSLPKYAGKGPLYHGAYGYRLINNEFNQIERAINALQNNPVSRQIVLSIWLSDRDLPQVSGYPIADDIPCNIICMLKRNGSKLDWSLIARSIDIYRGFPYDIFTFTVLHELFCSWVGMEIGNFTYFINNLHMYTNDAFHVESYDFQNIEDTLIPTISLDESNRLIHDIYCRMESMVKLSNTETEKCLELSVLNSNNWFFDDITVALGIYTSYKLKMNGNISILLEKVSSPIYKKLMLDWLKLRKGEYL